MPWHGRERRAIPAAAAHGRGHASSHRRHPHLCMRPLLLIAPLEQNDTADGIHAEDKGEHHSQRDRRSTSCIPARKAVLPRINLTAAAFTRTAAAAAAAARLAICRLLTRRKRRRRPPPPARRRPPFFSEAAWL